MSDKIGKTPLIETNGNICKLTRMQYGNHSYNEDWLQETIYKEPSVLPTADVDPAYGNLIPIGREIPVVCDGKTGYIDNLYISSRGYIVIVETKLWRNPESRREVIGQIIDYAKDVQKWDYETLNNIYKSNHNKNLFDELVALNYYSIDEEAKFIDTVIKNISMARFLLMIVGDGIREGLEKMVNFLNINPTMQYKLALCELEVYEMENQSKLIVPNLLLKTKVIERGIIVIDNDKVSFNSNENNEDIKQSENKYSKSNYLTLDGWIEKKLKDKSLEEKFRRMVQEVEDSSMFYTIGTSEFDVKYRHPEYNKTILMFMLPGDSGEYLSFKPYEYYSFLDKYTISKSIGDELVEGLRPYLSKKKQNHIPYENEKGYYYIDMNTFLDNREDIISLFERFISNI